MKLIKPDAISIINGFLQLGLGIGLGAIAMAFGGGWLAVSIASAIGAGLLRLTRYSN